METVSGDQKRDRKRKLLPLLALVVGLCVPVYAFAASEAECNWCHNTCTNNHIATMSYCQTLYGWDQWQCYQDSGATYMACHMNCEVPGGPCVE